MVQHRLTLSSFGIHEPRVGSLQRSGKLSVLPIFGQEFSEPLASPLSGVKLAGVEGYGNLTLENGTENLAIIPLHMGYIQDQAQNHALCRSAFLGPKQKVLFEDACCVQESQGGYLEDRDQWFFILPVHLREEALQKQGTKDYQKLWKSIAAVNRLFGKPYVGHLEQLIGRERSYLTQFQSRFELLPGQTGALFFSGQTLIGIEIAPNSSYFSEVWPALICFCYGPLGMYYEKQNTEKAPKTTLLPGKTIDDLKQALLEKRKTDLGALFTSLQTLEKKEKFSEKEEERYLDFRLSTRRGTYFSGQFVTWKKQIVYTSLAATRKQLRTL